MRPSCSLRSISSLHAAGEDRWHTALVARAHQEGICLRTFLGRKVSAGGVLGTESSLGLSFVAQPARGEKRFKAETEGPTGPGSGVLHVHLTSPRTRRVYKEQAADWRGRGGNMHPVCHQHSQNSAPPQAPKWQRPR